MGDEYGKHFIREVEIENYKCFNEFRADGFERVNLIGGMNNVGKTSFLEALLLNSYSQKIRTFISAVASIDYVRYQMDILRKGISGHFDLIQECRNSISNLSNFKIVTNQFTTDFSIIEKGLQKKFKTLVGKEYEVFTLDKIGWDSFESVENYSFLDQHGKTSKDLKESFAQIQKRDKETWSNKQISLFESDVDSFKFIGDVPSCHKISIDEYLDIHEFGDGLKSFISILCDLWKCSNGCLLIDEVDNGIHYSKFDRLWEIILTVSKETNCQIFATTHSKECLESFDRVSKKLGEKEITYNHLKRKKDNSIINQNYISRELHNAIESNHEVRGW